MPSILPEVERRLSTLQAFQRVNTAVDSARTAAEEAAKREEQEARRTGAATRDANNINETNRTTGTGRSVINGQSTASQNALSQNALSQNGDTNSSGVPAGAISRAGVTSRTLATTQGNSTNQSIANRTSTNRVSARGSIVPSASPNDSATQRLGVQSSSSTTFRTPTLQDAQRTAQGQLALRRSLNVLV
jgi:hypothetical protein